MAMTNFKNKRYLVVLALVTSNLFFFQNCSNYSATLQSDKLRSPSNLQMIADNSAALNDEDIVPNNDNVPIQLDPPVIPTPDDMRPEDEMNPINIPVSSNDPMSVDDPVSVDPTDPMAQETEHPKKNDNNSAANEDKNKEKDNDELCHNKGRKNCEYRNRCNLLAEAGGTLKGFNVITLTEADTGKALSASHGKTIYTYSGSTTLNIKSIESSGNTVICGNISITNLSTNGNCHLFYTQVEQANVNGNLSSNVLDDNGMEKVIDSKSGRDVKSCRVNSDALITPL